MVSKKIKKLIFEAKYLSIRRVKILFKEWTTGCISWYNKKLDKYRIEFEDGTEDYINLDDVNRIEMILPEKWYYLVNFCRKTLLFFSCIIVCFFLILPTNRPLCARNKVKSRCLIKDVRTDFRVIL